MGSLRKGKGGLNALVGTDVSIEQDIIRGLYAF